MGWTACHVTGELKNGRYVINRKAECDRILLQKLHESQGDTKEVLKSAMVGRVYYAAVKTTNSDGTFKIWAAVVLTSVDQKSYCNFFYKDQDETCGPIDCCCPKSILNLLTEPDSEYAKVWRKNCWKYHDSKRNAQSLDKLPTGSKISFINQVSMTNGIIPGDRIMLTKAVKPGKKRETKYWTDGKYKWSKSLISAEYEVVA